MDEIKVIGTRVKTIDETKGVIIGFYNGGENGLDKFEVAVAFPDEMVGGFPLVEIFKDWEVTKISEETKQLIGRIGNG